MLIKQLITNKDESVVFSKLNNNLKLLIINKASELSHELPKNSKEVINVEKFIYNIIYIIYSEEQ